MGEKMKAVVLSADWDPKQTYKPTPKDIPGKLTYLGSQVWRNPKLNIEDRPKPEIGPTDILIKVKMCGICGSDVHMAQKDDRGYIWYPGLTAFPATLGHEFSGEVVEAGNLAVNKRTGKRYAMGEPVCVEEMLWCGTCKPCVDGYPNHCENLQEIGFSVEGAFTRYIKVDAKYAWSLDALSRLYPGDKLFEAGSLVEPTSVAYNAVIERGGSIRPGDNVVILGGGPVGLAAVAILKRAGAANVILSEPEESRRKLGDLMGADHIINPAEADFAEAVLDITKGMGAKLYLEATGIPDKVFPGIEQAIWNGRELNSTVVIVARADKKIPVTGEVFQVRRANIVGAQGHSGHGTFPRVIAAMASGMDMTKLITKRVNLEEIPENIIGLQTDRTNCKITCKF